MSEFDNLLNEQLKDPAFKKEWEDIQPEMDIIRSMIDLRISQNLTQEDLAKRTGINQSDISKIENGTNNMKFSIDSVVNSPSSYNPHPPKSFPSGSNHISRFRTVRSNIIAV